MSRKNNREEFFFTSTDDRSKVFNPVSAAFPANVSEIRTYSLPKNVTTIGYISRGSAVISATGSDFKVTSKEAFVIEKIASFNCQIRIAADSTVSWFSCNGSLPEALTSAYATPTVGIRTIDISGIMEKIRDVLSDENESDEINNIESDPIREQQIIIEREKVLTSYFFDALSEFYYSASAINGNTPKKKISEAERIRVFIDNMIYSNPSLDDIRAHFGITKMHAIRVFKAKYNQTPMQYAIEHRTDVAATLLRTTDLPIKEISEMLHYSNTQHFSNSFKKLTGQSPNQYRTAAKHK